MEVIAVPPLRRIVDIKWGHQMLSSWLIVRHRTALLSSFKLVAQRPSPLPEVCFFSVLLRACPVTTTAYFLYLSYPAGPWGQESPGFRSQDSKSQDSPFQPSYSGFRLEGWALRFHGDVAGGTGRRAHVICCRMNGRGDWVPPATSIQSVGFFIGFSLVGGGGRAVSLLKKFEAPPVGSWGLQ